MANGIRRLAQGVLDAKGTNTMFYIPKSEIPQDRWKDITYGRIVVNYRPNIAEKNIPSLTVGGDRLGYPFGLSTPMCDLPTIKLLWNLVLSTPRAKYFTPDISNFYLGTSMMRPEFMRMPTKLILYEITYSGI